MKDTKKNKTCQDWKKAGPGRLNKHPETGMESVINIFFF